MLSATVSHSRGAGSAHAGNSVARRAARSLKPLLTLTHFLKCVAYSGIVYVAGTVGCWYQSSAGDASGGRYHIFVDRPFLCAFALLSALGLGLALRAKPRFQKILELHDKRSLFIRAAVIAGIVLLDVHALRRLGSAGVALAQISFQFLILPTLALVLLGKGNGSVPAKKLQGFLVIVLSLSLLFSSSHYLLAGRDFAHHHGPPRVHTHILAATPSGSLTGDSVTDSVGRIAPIAEHSHHHHKLTDHRHRVPIESARKPSADGQPKPPPSETAQAGDDTAKAAQRRRSRRHGLPERADGRKLLSVDEEDAAKDDTDHRGETGDAVENSAGGNGAASNDGSTPVGRNNDRGSRRQASGTQRLQTYMRVMATLHGIKCTSVACIAVAAAATLRLIRSSYYQLFGVKSAGALHLPMETLTTAFAAVLVLPFVVWEHFYRADATGSRHAHSVSSSPLRPEDVIVHGQKFVPEQTALGLWQGIVAFAILVAVGFVLAAVTITEYSVRGCTGVSPLKLWYHHC